MVTNVTAMVYNTDEYTTMSRDNFDFISPLDTRYYGAEPAIFDALHPYLSEAATIRYQLKVEQAIIASLEYFNVAPAGMSRRVAQAVEQITPAEVYEEEHRTHHNIRALVNCVRSKLPESDRGYVHLFATSADIQDTARSLAMRDLTREILLPDVRDLVTTLIALAREYAETPQIGRTHGRHAEPITVGYWLANYVMRLSQRAELIAKTAKNLRGMYSGAVGAHSALSLGGADAGTEEDVLSRLGLKPAEGRISTQVVQPEYLTDFAHALVSTFSVFANLADDYRHLMRSEIDEVRERLDSYEVGSSTMPHKVNPKNFENVKSLWKEFMPRMVTIYLDQVSEHQRDLTNSASMRFFNELVAGSVYATRRLRDAVRKTEFNVVAIQKNLEESFPFIIAEPLYISFALAGHPDPYDTVRALVIDARDRGEDLLTFMQTDEEAKKLWEKVPAEQKEVIRDPRKYVGDAPERTHTVCDLAEMLLSETDLTIAQLERPKENIAFSLDRPDLPSKKSS